MAELFFTSDFHLGHRNIIRYCERPFASVAEMDDAILDRLNSVVKDRDHLYFLGDFCIGGGKRAEAYLARIRCQKIHFVLGNHDRDLGKAKDRFVWVKDLTEVVFSEQRIVLCHYALRVWNHHRRGAWHLFGHSHGKLPDDPASKSLDVGVDSHGFVPWHFEEIQSVMSKKRPTPVENGDPIEDLP